MHLSGNDMVFASRFMLDGVVATLAALLTNHVTWMAQIPLTGFNISMLGQIHRIRLFELARAFSYIAGSLLRSSGAHVVYRECWLHCTTSQPFREVYR